LLRISNGKSLPFGQLIRPSTSRATVWVCKILVKSALDLSKPDAHALRLIFSASIPWPERQRTEEVVGDHLIEMPSRVLALADRMRAIRVGEHRELLVVLDQFVDQ